MFRRFGWRLLFVVAFIPLGAPPLLVVFLLMIAASVAWLVAGPGVRDGKSRLDRWADSAFTERLFWPLDRLMRKAEVLRELWV